MRLRNQISLWPRSLLCGRGHATERLFSRAWTRRQRVARSYSSKVHEDSPPSAEQAALRKNAGIHRLPHAALASYLECYSTRDEDAGVASHHRELREATAVHFPRSAHQAVSPQQGRTLRLLASMTGARRILELGCFTGQSALWLAEGAMQGARRRGTDPASIEVITCERDVKAAALAREWIAHANLEAQITVEMGEADATLHRLDPQKPFDLIFLGKYANKSGYIHYLDIILERNLLADYGFIIADNVLFRGDTVRVANALGELFLPPYNYYEGKAGRSDASMGDGTLSLELEENSRASVRRAATEMHRFNSYVAQDPRVEALIWPLFDGVNIIQKRL